MRCKSIPIGLGDAVLCFMAVSSGKDKWAIDVRVRMCKIEPPLERHKLTLCCMSLRHIEWANEMRSRGRSSSGNIADKIILQPITLIDSIEMDTVVMEGVEVHQEMPILKA